MDNPSTSTPSEWGEVHCGLADRLRRIREDLYGLNGGPMLATELKIPYRHWFEFETGTQIPPEILLRFLELTEANPRWLLSGEGEIFRRDRSRFTPPAPDEPDDL